MELITLWEGRNIIGEGPLWHPTEQALYWIDILKPSLHRLDWNTRDHQEWDMPDMIGCIAHYDNDHFIAAIGGRIVKINIHDRSIIELVELIVGRENLRLNDGACDRQGRFWVGSMDMSEVSKQGGLYRYDPDGAVHLLTEQLIVSNGLAWSLDNSKLYHCDSGLGKIFQYAFDPDTGTLGNREVLVEVPKEAGFPDGMCIDNEGCLWVGHWDGWRIVRYTPDGQIDRMIKMPVARATCCAFAGPNLDTLVITTACYQLSQDDLKTAPLSGSVFALNVGVTGVAEPSFAAPSLAKTD